MVSHNSTLTVSQNSCSFVAETASVNTINSCKVSAATTESCFSLVCGFPPCTVTTFYYISFVKGHVQKASSEAIRRNALNYSVHFGTKFYFPAIPERSTQT